jgi:hypothetical protein
MLNPDHTHFFLVSRDHTDNTIAPFGHELPILKAFERALMSRKGGSRVVFLLIAEGHNSSRLDIFENLGFVFSLLLVVEGGPNSLTVFLDAVNSGVPAVVGPVPAPCFQCPPRRLL